MPPGIWLQCRAVYTAASGKQMEAICWFTTTVTVADPPGDVEAAADVFSGSIAAPFKDCLTTDATYEGVNATLHQTGSSYTAVQLTGTGSGTVSGDESPDFVSVCLRKRGTQVGRSGIGRWFIGAVPEDLTELNSVEFVTGMPNYTTLADALGSGIIAGGSAWTAAHYSKHLNTFGPIGSTSVDKLLARQGRRKKLPLI